MRYLPTRLLFDEDEEEEEEEEEKNSSLVGKRFEVTNLCKGEHQPPCLWYVGKKHNLVRWT